MESNGRQFGSQTNQFANQGRTGRLCPTCSLHVADGMSVCPNDGTPLAGIMQGAPRPVSNLAGQYEFLAKIGEGGMGVIYKARHLALNNLVAIKMMHVNRMDEAKLLRFQQEAKAVSALDHPSIVRVRDFGISEAGQPHMVLDFIDGVTLEDMIKTHGPVSLTDARDMFEQICDAIAHAHQRNVLHRDLKPSNIMLVYRENQPPLVKIVDFGIAKVVDPAGEQGMNLTQTGEVFGSPFYMSPEQTAGKEIDKRSDMYSIACVLFESLTGAPPFVGKNSIETLIKHTSEAPPTLKEGSLGKVFPDELQAVVSKALAKNPNDRYQDMTSFKNALVASIDNIERQPAKAKGKGSGTGTGADSDASVPFYRSKVAIISGAVMGAALLVGIPAIFLLQSKQPKPTATVSTNPAVTNATSSGTTSTSAVTGMTTTGHPDSAVTAATSESSPVTKLSSEPLQRSSTPMDEDEFGRQNILKSKNKKLIVVSALASDKMMSAFDEIHETEHIALDGTAITGAALVHFKNLPLKILTLKNDKAFTDSGAEQLAAIKSLESLSFAGTAITDNTLKAVATLPHLQALSVSGTKITDAGLKYLRQCHSLKYLDLSDCDGVGDSSVQQIAQIKKLDSLSLAGTQISDAGVKALMGLSAPKLKMLDLSNTMVTDAAIKGSRAQPQLDELRIGNSKIGAEAFKDIPKFAPHLQGLSLEGSQSLRNSELKLLESIKSLRRLSLKKTKISDGGVTNLLEIPLVELNLEASNISNDSLRTLEGLRSLRKLNVLAIQRVTIGGVAAFEEAFARCKITPRPSIFAPPPYPGQKDDE